MGIFDLQRTHCRVEMGAIAMDGGNARFFAQATFPDQATDTHVHARLMLPLTKT